MAKPHPLVGCERLFEPRLEGVPLGVLSNNDGCVIARSEEFKALDFPGVDSAELATAPGARPGQNPLKTTSKRMPRAPHALSARMHVSSSSGAQMRVPSSSWTWYGAGMFRKLYSSK